jgi:hypothetical protein
MGWPCPLTLRADAERKANTLPYPEVPAGFEQLRTPEAAIAPERWNLFPTIAID